MAEVTASRVGGSAASRRRSRVGWIRGADVAAALTPWFRRHRRRFSFRQRLTPFRILVAELLLRKTRASDVDAVFPQLIELCADARALSRVDRARLRKLISPLGLARRADTLIALGKALVERHGGAVPQSESALRALPGVGPYTAGAVLSIGFGKRHAMVDGPVGRLLRRVSGMQDRGRAAYYDPDVWAFAGDLVAGVPNARTFQLALLDVAARLCRPHNPLCANCPLVTMCSFASGRSDGRG